MKHNLWQRCFSGLLALILVLSLVLTPGMGTKASAAAYPYEDIVWSFEDGTADPFTTTVTLGGKVSSLATAQDGTGALTLLDGKYWINSILNQVDGGGNPFYSNEALGEFVSPDFYIDPAAPVINMVVNGGSNDEVYAAVYDAETDAELVRLTWPASWQLVEKTIDLTGKVEEGQAIYLKFVDNATSGGFCWFGADNIRFKGIIVEDASKHIHWDFEDGTLGDFEIVSGSFGTIVSNIPKTHNSPFGAYPRQGNYHLSTLETTTYLEATEANVKNYGEDATKMTSPSDAYKGVLQSPMFLLEDAHIDFLVGGGKGSTGGTYVALCDVYGRELMKASGPDGETMTRVEWDASAYVGQYVFVKVVDGDTGGWGHVTFDDFHAFGTVDAEKEIESIPGVEDLTYGNITWGFEDGTAYPFTKGTGTFNQVMVYDMPSDWNTRSLAIGKVGNYWLQTFSDSYTRNDDPAKCDHKGSEGYVGVLVSPKFVLNPENTTIKMQLGGNTNNRVYVVDALTNTTVGYAASGKSDWKMTERTVTWNSGYQYIPGTELYLEVRDTTTGGYGFICLDNIQFSGQVLAPEYKYENVQWSFEDGTIAPLKVRSGLAGLNFMADAEYDLNSALNKEPSYYVGKEINKDGKYWINSYSTAFLTQTVVDGVVTAKQQSGKEDPTGVLVSPTFFLDPTDTTITLKLGGQSGNGVYVYNALTKELVGQAKVSAGWIMQNTSIKWNDGFVYTEGTPLFMEIHDATTSSYGFFCLDDIRFKGYSYKDVNWSFENNSLLPFVNGGYSTPMGGIVSTYVSGGTVADGKFYINTVQTNPANQNAYNENWAGHFTSPIFQLDPGFPVISMYLNGGTPSLNYIAVYDAETNEELGKASHTGGWVLTPYTIDLSAKFADGTVDMNTKMYMKIIDGRAGNNWGFFGVDAIRGNFLFPTENHGHVFSDWKVITAATCVADGLKNRICSICGEIESEVIPATGEHTYAEAVTPPTCGEDGYTTHTCSVCGDSYTDTEVPATGEHTKNEEIPGVVTEPNCTEGGYTTYTCSVCGKTYTADETEPTGVHTKNEEIPGVVTPPTCGEAGYTTYTCAVCGETYTADPTEATGEHAYKYTCTEAGKHTITCENCDYSEVADCEYDEGVVYEPTCAVAGYTKYSCLHCEYSYIVTGESATGNHKFDYTPAEAGKHKVTCATCDYDEVEDCEYNEVVTPPTCGVNGYTTYTCKHCEYSYVGNEQPATGDHAYEYTPAEAGKHTVTCENCDYTAVKDCEYKSVVTPPTCDTDGYTTHTCMHCGYSFTDSLVEGGHSYTYTDNGNRTHTVGCENCDLSEIEDCVDEDEDSICDKCEGVLAEYVAQIGDVKYIDLQKAMDEAEPGDTVKLLTSIEVPEAGVSAKKKLTIDLNGNAVMSIGDVFVAVAGAELTIINSSEVEANVIAETDGIGSSCAVWANGGKVIIEGGSYQCGGDSNPKTDPTHQNDCIYTKNSGTVVINGGKFYYTEGVWTLNENDANRGTITVYGGEFVNFDPMNNTSEGANTNFLAEGLHTKNVDGIYSICEHTGEYVEEQNRKEPTLNATGSYDTVTKCSVCDFEIKRVTTTIPQLEGAVAEIDGYKYATLQEAIEAADPGETVKLLAEVALTEQIIVDKDITFDLNGNKLIGPDDGQANWYAFVVNGGDMIFKDSVGTGELWAKCYGIETKSGSLTVESGKITATNNKKLGTAVVNYGGTVTINGGELSGYLGSVITGGHFAEAETVITGGTLTGDVGVASYNSKGSVIKSASNTVEPAADYKWVLDGEVYVLTAKDYIVQVDDAKFETLAEANEAAVAGNTVTLLTDVVVSEDLTLKAGVIYDIPAELTLTVAEGASVTADAAATLNCFGTIIVAGEADISALSYGTTFGACGGKLTIKATGSVVMLNEWEGVWTPVNDAQLGSMLVACEAGAKVSVGAQNWELAEAWAHTNHDWDAGVLTEATYTADAFTTYTCKVCGETKVETHEGTMLPSAAKIGGDYFETVQEAITAAQPGETIDLTADCDDVILVNKPMTIKSNGFKLDVNNIGIFKYEGKSMEATEFEGGIVIAEVAASGANAGAPLAYIDGDPTNLMTLQAALDAAAAQQSGEENVVVKLTGDLTVDDIFVIPDGVTLDIEANELTVKSLIGVSGSKLNAGTPDKDGNGIVKLYVAKENLILAEEAFVNSDGRTVLPIWNGDHYEFGQFQVRVTETDSQGLFVDEANKTIKFVFRHVNNGWYVNNVLNNNNATNSGIKVVLELSWKVKDAEGKIVGTPFQNFVYTEELFQEILDGGDNYTFTLSGYDAMYLDPAQMQIVAKVVSDTGACAVLDPVGIGADKLN